MAFDAGNGQQPCSGRYATLIKLSSQCGHNARSAVDDSEGLLTVIHTLFIIVRDDDETFALKSTGSQNQGIRLYCIFRDHITYM